MVEIAAAFFLLGLACLFFAAVYYVRAKRVHAKAEELQEITRANVDTALEHECRAADILSRFQEHFVA